MRALGALMLFGYLGGLAVIADPDGGCLNRFYDPARGDVILNPFDRRAHTWDLYGEITPPHDVEQLARSLTPDPPGTTAPNGCATPAPSSNPSLDRRWRPGSPTSASSIGC